ncbi:MAG: ABC transporter ATP-binding protein [Pseudomonadota bacterium]
MKQAWHLLRLNGLHSLLAVCLWIVPIAVLEVVTLLLIRGFFLLIAVRFGDTPLDVDTYLPLIDAGDQQSFVIAGLLLVFALLIRAVIGNFFGYQVIFRALRLQMALGRRLFETYLAQPLADRLLETQSENQQTLLLVNTGLVHQVLVPMVNLLSELMVALAILLVLIVVMPLPTIVIMAWLLLFYATYSIISKGWSKRAGEVRWGALNRLRTIMDGAFGDPRWVKLTGSEQMFSRLYGEAGVAYTRASSMDVALYNAPRFLLEITLVSCVLILAVMLANDGRTGGEVLADLMLFAAAAVRLLPAVSRTSGLIHGLRTRAPDLEKVAGDLALATEALRPASREDRPPFLDSLKLEDVTYTYPGAAKPALSGVSLSIVPGERIFVSGESGGGKSTLLAILLGLLRPSTGEVFVDGAEKPVLDIMRATSSAIVPQDPFIMNGSIGENMTFPEGAETLDKEWARALLADLALSFELEDHVGEGGGLMSGGQRQRLAVARALYRRPRFLILDEATSHLDSDNAARVYDALDKWCPEATVIIVSHETPPDGFCHRQLKIGQGRIQSTDDAATETA